MGLEGGKPAAGQVGAQPEWFYKGDGSILVAHGRAPAHARPSLVMAAKSPKLPASI